MQSDQDRSLLLYIDTYVFVSVLASLSQILFHSFKIG